MSRYEAIREECRAANAALPASGLVDLTFGNVSVCDREAGVFAIKPSGVPYSALKTEDMVIVDFDGRVVEGTLNPSSDTPTHRRLFLGFPGIRSVVHTHSRKAVAFAQAARGIPLLGTTHADYFRGEVPVTRALTTSEICDAYEWATGNVIVERFEGLDPLEIPAVLVRNHGPFAWGPSGAKAVENALTLDPSAQPPSLAPLRATLPEKTRPHRHLRAGLIHWEGNPPAWPKYQTRKARNHSQTPPVQKTPEPRLLTPLRG